MKKNLISSAIFGFLFFVLWLLVGELTWTEFINSLTLPFILRSVFTGLISAIIFYVLLERKRKKEKTDNPD